MIKVDVHTKEQDICKIMIHGHAGYADAGQDLVCAGVSSIAVGMLNALHELVPHTCDLQMKKGNTMITTICSSANTQLLLKAMLWQLKTMEETYPNYIKINEQEV